MEILLYKKEKKNNPHVKRFLVFIINILIN